MGMILNMSITGSVVILFVLFARLVLKKAPKVFSYALWTVVLFRLLCPVTIATDFSLLRLFDAPTVENTQYTTAVEYVPYDVVHTQELEVQLPVPSAINEAVNEALPREHAVLGADPLEGEFAVGSMVWVLGMGVMLIYSAVSYVLLRRKLIGTVLLRDNIYLADGIGTPFVMGLIRPKIYLPSALSEQEQGYIILHEQHHIHRGDHIIKLLAFLALCIHWFNPLVWVAFALSSKDMEMSCDEAVVKKLGESICADYSASLLSLATGRRIIAGTPLAFGEGDTRSRIKNMLKWKKAKPFVVVLAAVTVILVLMVCGTNAAKDDSWIKVKAGATSVELDCNFEAPIQSYAIYEDVYENGQLILSEAILFDSFQGEGGATPRQTRVMLNAQPVYDEESGFVGELSLYAEIVGAMHMTRELPKEHYTGIAHIPAEIGTRVFNRQKITSEDNVPLLTVLLSTEPDGEVVVDARGQTWLESNDTIVAYRLVTSEEGGEQFFRQNDTDGTDMAADVFYDLELNEDGNQTKVEKLLSSAEQNLREGYKPVSLAYVDNSKVGWDFYEEEPWETAEQRDALAQTAMQELYTLTGYQVEECVYTTDGRSRFIFGKSEEYIRKCIAFYSRDFGFTLAGDQVPWQGFVNARRAHYSDVQQMDSPYHKKEYSGQGAISTWFLEHSGVYQGEKVIGFDAINLDDTVYTHIKLNFDGGYYLVVMDEKIESAHEVSGPYAE